MRQRSQSITEGNPSNISKKLIYD